MKRTFDKNTYKIELDNEAVKAIRFVKGFNPSLRVSLKGISEESLYWWLDANRFELFGLEFGLSKPEATDEAYNKYERCLKDVVRQIVR